MSFLLGTCNPYIIDDQCNFLLKIVESLLHNWIIISTLYYEHLKGIISFKTFIGREN